MDQARWFSSHVDTYDTGPFASPLGVLLLSTPLHIAISQLGHKLFFFLQQHHPLFLHNFFCSYGYDDGWILGWRFPHPFRKHQIWQHNPQENYYGLLILSDISWASIYCYY